MSIKSAVYTAHAHTTGGRTGTSTTDDGRLTLTLDTPKALGGNDGAGTNPEQLFAAGYAACFGSALALVARKQKAPLSDSAIDATVELHPDGQGGFKLGVALAVETKGIDQATADALVAAAHKVCPYSNAIKGNIDVALTAKAL